MWQLTVLSLCLQLIMRSGHLANRKWLWLVMHRPYNRGVWGSKPVLLRRAASWCRRQDPCSTKGGSVSTVSYVWQPVRSMKTCSGKIGGEMWQLTVLSLCLHLAQWENPGGTMVAVTCSPEVWGSKPPRALRALPHPHDKYFDKIFLT